MKIIIKEIVKQYGKAVENMRKYTASSPDSSEMLERIYSDSIARLERLGG